MNKKVKNDIALIIFIIFVISGVLALFMANNIFDFGIIFTLLSGLLGWLAFYYYFSQIMIDKNLFGRYAFIGLIILFFNVLIQFFTKFNLTTLFISACPFIYVYFLRLLIFLFYREYPNLKNKPVIIYGNRFGKAFYKGDNKMYKPTKIEKIFSITLFIGFLLLAFGTFFILINYFNFEF